MISLLMKTSAFVALKVKKKVYIFLKLEKAEYTALIKKEPASYEICEMVKYKHIASFLFIPQKLK